MPSLRNAFLVGISEFDQFYNDLPCARVDVLKLNEILKNISGPLAFDNIISIYGYKNDKKLRQEFKEFTVKIKKDLKLYPSGDNSLSLIYLSSHGFINELGDYENQFTIATSDSNPQQPSIGLKLNYFLQYWEENDEKINTPLLIILDCCFSGAVAIEKSIRGKIKNLTMLASSSHSQKSFPSEKDQLSHFTKALVKALQGLEPKAIRHREIGTESIHYYLKGHFDSREVQEHVYVPGSKDIILSRPDVEIQIVEHYEKKELNEAFKEYLFGRINILKDYEEIIKDKYFIRLKCDYENVKKGNIEKDTLKEELALDILQQWSTSKSPICFLLGDLGSGKTYTLKRFWYELAKKWNANHENPIPMFIELNILSGTRLRERPLDEKKSKINIASKRRFRAVITDNLRNKEGIRIDWHAFLVAVQEGQIILILDGLDEMELGGNEHDPGELISLIRDFITLKSKVIVSCRRHYLKKDKEIVSSACSHLDPQPDFPLLKLKNFQPRDIEKYLKARIDQVQFELWESGKSKEFFGFEELAMRPFLLEVIVKNFNELVDKEGINPNKLYDKFINAWLDRDRWRFNQFLCDFEDVISFSDYFSKFETNDLNKLKTSRNDWTDEILTKFLELIGIDFWRRDQFSIEAEAIPARIRDYFPRIPNILLQFLDYTLRTCTFLTRTEQGKYTFLHESIPKYLAARYLENDLLNPNYWWDRERNFLRLPQILGEKKLSNEILNFIYGLIRLKGGNIEDRLKNIVQSKSPEIYKSPFTKYYLQGNCLSIIAALNKKSIPKGIKLGGIWLNGCFLYDCNLIGLNLSNTTFDDCILEKAKFDNSILNSVKIINTSLKEASFQNVKINGEEPAIIIPKRTEEEEIEESLPDNLVKIIRRSKSSTEIPYKHPISDNITEVVHLEGGEFIMGGDYKSPENQKPSRKVFVSSFLIDIYPVTNEQFKLFIDSNPEWSKDAVIARYGIPYYLSYWTRNEPPEGFEKYPAVYVSWYAAEAYAKWVGKRLPKEAEWEYAVRDGHNKKNYRFPYGNSVDDIPKELRELVKEKIDLSGPINRRFLPIKPAEGAWRYSKNYRILDLNGNVNEWVQDWYSESYYEERVKKGIEIDVNPLGPITSEDKVLRGSSFAFQPDTNWSKFRTYYRSGLPPRNTNQDCGFRCVCDVSIYKKFFGALPKIKKPIS